MERKEYNGWANYETWNVALWMDNDQGSNEYWRERAQELFDATDEDSDSRKDDAAADLANEIQAQHDEAMPEVSGCFADLLGAAMSEVDWREIAEHLLSDIDVQS
jgi:hypothetical protein